jgi:catechol 2,3-dioxygenase-like lactoylglutathione lyase family enzyme
MVARDAGALAAFYGRVFGCEEVRAPRALTGAAVWRGNGLHGVDIISVWLSLPGVEGPFLEILEYGETRNRARPRVNEPGYGHIAFEVEDIGATMAGIVAAGGTGQGEITTLGTGAAQSRAVYMRDPEGNLIELEERPGAG